MRHQCQGRTTEERREQDDVDARSLVHIDRMHKAQVTNTEAPQLRIADIQNGGTDLGCGVVASFSGRRSHPTPRRNHAATPG